MGPSATGKFDQLDDDQFQLILHRHFEVSPESVWTVLTDSKECGRWMGTWTGDPASGEVQMTMVAEEGNEPQTVKILRCDPPMLVRVQQGPAEQPWILEARLAENGSATELTFTQPMDREFALAMLPDIGPGWEFYLDRLVAAVAGEDANQIKWDDYYPSLKAPYETMARRAEG